MNCTICGRWFETTGCPGPHLYELGPPRARISDDTIEAVNAKLAAAEAHALALEAQLVEARAYGKAEHEEWFEQLNQRVKADAERDTAQAQRDAALAFVRDVAETTTQPGDEFTLDIIIDQARDLLAAAKGTT
jgi:hypothetical protein